MHLPTYPPSALSAFAHLYQLHLNGTSISHISPEVGLGVLFHPEKYNPAHRPLLTIGKDLILSAESVESTAKGDHWIRDLLRVCCGLYGADAKENEQQDGRESIPGLDLSGEDEEGAEEIQPWGRSPRLMIMLFLAVMMVRGSVEIEEFNEHKRKAVGVGSGGIWSEYIKFLPDVSIPTTWTEEESALLRGTSLDSAVISKKSALAREFHTFQHLTSFIPWCQEYLWNPSSPSLTLTLQNWVQIDAWFRSRVLELPGIGVCLIPYLDMVNHSSDAANAYYNLNSDSDIDLLPIEADDDGLLKTKATTEVWINYGAHKSSAELLHSYGFLNITPASCQWLSLPLPLSPADPLTPCKLHTLGAPPTVKLIDLPSSSPSSIAWLSTTIWLLITNAEDGLEYKVLQQTNGNQNLALYWHAEDDYSSEDGILIEDLDTLRQCLENSNLWEVFHLRAIVTIQQVVADKLQSLDESEEIFTTIAESGRRSISEGQQEEVRAGVIALARELRERERRLLVKSLAWFEREKERLVQLEVVKGYLAKAQEGEGNGGDGAEEEEDFS